MARMGRACREFAVARLRPRFHRVNLAFMDILHNVRPLTAEELPSAFIDGQEVSGGKDSVPGSGYVCLESEGAPIEFTDIRIRELP